MSSLSRGTWRRVGFFGLAAGLMLLLAGDRGAWTAPAPGGIDPLDILNLQIRANAIIVLDSSGSMGETLGGGDLGGDDPDAKLYLAKQTLKKVIKDNERKVSFQFGQYEQPGIGGQAGSVMGVPTTGLERFLYTTTSTKSASMISNEMVVDLRSFNIPTGTVIQFTEGTTQRTSPALTTGRYASGVLLATELQARINATTGKTNTYTVVYNDTHQFVFTKTGTATFSLRWTSMTGLQALIHPGGANQGPTTGNPASLTSTAQPANCGSGGDCDLKRRNATDSKFTEVGVNYYKLYARRFFNGQRLLVRQPSGVVCSVTGFTALGATGQIPQTGLGGTGQLTIDTDGDGVPDDFDRPWIELERADASCNVATGTNAQVVKFTFSSVPRADATNNQFPGAGEWRTWGGSTTCGGFESLVDLRPCTDNGQFSVISPFLENEISIDATSRFPVGYVENTDGSINGTAGQPDVAGMRAAGNTPIAESLTDINAVWGGTLWPTIRAYGGGNGPYPKTFVIFLTDGDDTCETPDGDTGGGTLTDDQKALRAAYRAQVLYTPKDATTPQRQVASSVTTFVVAFGSGASASRSNWIAWGGSGLNVEPPTTGVIPIFDNGGTIGKRWGAVPTLAQRNACPTCKDAFLATDTKKLSDALQIAIDQGQTAGIFSDQQSVTESIYELAYLAPTPSDPRAPENRYTSSLPVLLQSTFEMPDFQGHLKAFRRGGAGTLEQWDAGQKMFDRVVTNGMTTTGQWTFTELRGAGSTDTSIGTSSAKIKRRIYTTAGNGVFTSNTPATLVDDLIKRRPNGRVTLWPPETTVDPPGGGGTFPAGVFDDQLGIGAGSVPPLSFIELQSRFGACTGAPLPGGCTAASTSGTARREAREIILAHMAGAELVQLGGVGVRNTSGELLFRARSWILGESTLAAPAVAGPPGKAMPRDHTTEWTMFVEGPRASGGKAQNGVDFGFGLREPDRDKDPTSAADSDLKPVMSVTYHAANDMLHAFRAGPCRDTAGQPICSDSRTETGGEELWGFVPFDILGALKDRMGQQIRNPHTFMIAAPVRLTDVFVPGTVNQPVGTVTVSQAGVWRTVIMFGRGIGGKSLTALDITTPGPFTRSSLDANGPLPLWSRGNPDTQDGFPTGTPNNPAAGNRDLQYYKNMGETWSTPAIGFVDPAVHTTARKSGGVEFVAYLGSGFGDTTGCAAGLDPCEGKRFYTLDVLTGDVVATFATPDRSGTVPFPNAIVAGPAAFNRARMSFNTKDVHPAKENTERVYINDTHGRVWRVMTTSPSAGLMLADMNGTDTVMKHPLGVGAALINASDGVGAATPHIYVETGHDNRIYPPDAPTPTTPPFKLVGLMDDDQPTDPNPGDDVAGPVTRLFTKFLPDLFRGSAQPTTAFDDNQNGRVFFAATRYNPPATIFAPPPPPCRSSFDSLLYALGAHTGNAAFDLNATGQDEYVQYTGEKIQSISIVSGKLVVDRALGAEIAPEPPAPASIAGAPADPGVYMGLSIGPEWPVSNRTALRMGSSVCH